MDTEGNVRHAFGAEFPVVIGGDFPFHSRSLDLAPDGSLWVLPVGEACLVRSTRAGGREPSWALDTAFVLRPSASPD